MEQLKQNMEQIGQNAALLVMDMQTYMLSNFPGASTVIAGVAKAIKIARDHNVPVIYVVVGFRQGHPEFNTENKGFNNAKAMLTGIDMRDFITIHPDLAPLEHEITVIKKRVSAFSGSDLEIILRSQHIRHIVLTGISTGGVVLSTLREAADKDYQITVLSDGCAERDEETHKVLLTNIFPRQAEVLSSEEWNSTL